VIYNNSRTNWPLTSTVRLLLKHNLLAFASSAKNLHCQNATQKLVSVSTVSPVYVKPASMKSVEVNRLKTFTYFYILLAGIAIGYAWAYLHYFHLIPK